MALIKIQDYINNNEISYHMEDRLKNSLDEKVIKALDKKDKDYVLAIDGMEGAGKSTLAFQIGRYVDNTLGLSRICFDAKEFRQAIFDARKGQCVIYDEAFTGLSSRAALSEVNRMLISLMMQMRQKNLFVIIVLPTFFLLDKYVALFRARTLIHVFESKGKRGFFRLFNRKKKKLLYLTGKQTYTYTKVKTNFHGKFYGKFALGDDAMEREYKRMKSKALESVEKKGYENINSKYKRQRDWALYYLKKEADLTYMQMESMMKSCKNPLAKSQLGLICSRFEENMAN